MDESSLKSVLLGGAASIGIFVTSFLGRDIKKIDRIDKNVAVLNSKVESLEENAKLWGQIAHDVNTIKGQKEGVSLAVLDQIDHLEKLIGNKFSEYDRTIKDHDRRIVIISKRQQRKKSK
ncbi:MAG: hypothetical protein VKL60_18065 [Sphaerospermopsis sp.]|nr:hypothetical protein [Sphaerospermopsis sp.]